MTFQYIDIWCVLRNELKTQYSMRDRPHCMAFHWRSRSLCVCKCILIFLSLLLLSFVADFYFTSWSSVRIFCLCGDGGSDGNSSGSSSRIDSGNVSTWGSFTVYVSVCAHTEILTIKCSIRFSWDMTFRIVGRV